MKIFDISTLENRQVTIKSKFFGRDDFALLLGEINTTIPCIVMKNHGFYFDENSRLMPTTESYEMIKEVAKKTLMIDGIICFDAEFVSATLS